jgi:thiamine-phosphate pyrophosphorylase
MALPEVHLVTDRRLVASLPARLEAALAGIPAGRVAVHLREKDLGGAALLALARELLAVCRARGARLLVNDRLDVAQAAGADGVHLPAAGIPPAEARRLLGPSALVGVSCHSAEEVARARDAGADFATFSPIWDTPSKRAFGAPVGLAALAEASRLGLPLVALGGVEPGNAAQAAGAGARGVAAIRAWLVGPAPAAQVAGLLAPFLDRPPHGGYGPRP